MQHMKKLIALALAVLTVLGATLMAGCSNSKNNETTPVPSNTEAPGGDQTPEPEDSTEKSELPADLKFPGETFRIFYRKSLEEYNIVGNSENGDNISLSVFKRNENVQNQLGVKFEYISGASDNWKDTSAEIRTMVSSAEDAWDVVFSSGNSLIQYYLNEYFRDLSEIRYVDWEKSWWYLDGIKELSVDGEKYRYLIGDLILANLLTAGAVYVNKDLFTATYGSYDQITDLVLNGQWTHDKFYEYIQGCYKDVNGDLIANDGDTLGFVGPHDMSILYLGFATDHKQYERDADGKPIITVNNERTIQVLESLAHIKALPNIIFDGTNDGAYFASGNALFYIVNLNYLTGTTLRGSSISYGVLPCPKIDLAQENYRTLIHNSSSELAVPKTVPDGRMDMIGACLEALSYEGHRIVVPEVYEIALKNKYVENSTDAQIITIIHDTMTKDFLYEYSANINRIGTMLQDLLKANSTDFASMYSSKIDQATLLLDQLYENEHTKY